MLLLSAAPVRTQADEPARKPNFVFIIADDCTVWDIACYGGQAKTPNMDRLAAEGLRFTRCFQAAPICSPTRHNLLTGLWPVTSGAYPNHTMVKKGTRSIAHYLQSEGYRVALSGKRHIAPRASFPFEYSGKKNNPDMAAIGRLLAECRESRTPFCLFACSNEPHSPWNKGDASQYELEDLVLPPYFVDSPTTRRNFRAYLAEITYFDAQVGEVLSLLDQHGHRDNTLVMVVSEQGSSFPFAKWTCYGMGLQSACVVRWPGEVAAGRTSHAMIEYIDVVPTFLEAAGARVPESLQGRSFLDVLRGRTDRHKEYSFGLMTTRGINSGSDHFGIRTVFDGRFRYIWNLTPEVEFRNACTESKVFGEWMRKAEAGDAAAAALVHRYRRRPAIELYDVRADRYEQKNLADDPRLDQRKAELRARLLDWMQLCGDEGQATELRAFEHQTRRRRARRR